MRKPCPYCSAQLEGSAQQCRHCGRWLDPHLDSTLNADAPFLVLPPRETSGLAIASLVCAIFGVGPGSIAAVILGHLALRQIRRDPLRVSGKGMAKAGIVLGWMGILTVCLILTLALYFGRKLDLFPGRSHTTLVRLTAVSFSRRPLRPLPGARVSP